MKLQNKLNNLDRYPFHMPGHKRSSEFGIIGANIDVTEIDGMDNLHSPADSILEIENNLARIYRSAKSYLLVNGSTVGILASIFAVCNRGDKIIVARNCHISVYNACMLLDLKVVYIEPDFDYVDGYYTCVSQNAIDEALSSNSDAVAVVVTSPTYEGNISNVRATVPLIIDSAHGAHLGQSYFPSYPKGDIVVSSLHKTLPALTQTAVVNVYNDKYISRVKRYLDIFETSSPSYVLMNSVDICVDFVLNNKRAFDDYYARLCDFRCDELHNLRLKFTDDPSKLVISTANTNISGTELADILRNKYSIEVEMASSTYVILMTSVADTKGAFDMLSNALLSIDDSLITRANDIAIKPPVPSNLCNISIDDDSAEVDFDSSVGRVCNEYVYAYPPDIPIIVPGEIITSDTVLYIKRALSNGVNIVTTTPNKILTKR